MSIADQHRRLVLVDFVSSLASLLLVMGTYRHVGFIDPISIGSRNHSLLLIAIFAIILLIRLAVTGAYDVGKRFQRVDDVLKVLGAAFTAACVTVTIGVASYGFFLDGDVYSRGVILLGFVVNVALLLIHRLLGYHMQIAAFQQGRSLAKYLVVGDPDNVKRYVDWITPRLYAGVDPKASAISPELDVAEYMREFVAELQSVEPDCVVLAFANQRPDLRAAVAREAAFSGFKVQVLPEVFENYYDMPFAPREGVPIMPEIESERLRASRGMKNILDRVAATLGLIVLSPLFAIIALAIWLEDRGSAIFHQNRVGERGRQFRLRKFRTMRVDAEKLLSELVAQNEADGPIFKMRSDPRVTRVGGFLRRTSLDELPQLWNVAWGEMSLVGPRPPIPAEVDEYRLSHVRRLMVRPGMTGLWQVSGRSETTFDEMVRLDLVYISNWSFALDLKILLRTVAVVLRRNGAY